MKKKIMTVTLAAIALFSTAAFAQDAKPQRSGQKNTAECCKANENKECIQMLMFDGIQLTDSQKDQLKAIASPAKARQERDRKAKQECKAAAKQDRQNYLNSVKSVLTPEQYTQFLENSFINAPAKRHDRKGQCRKGGDRRLDGKQRPASDNASRK